MTHSQMFRLSTLSVYPVEIKQVFPGVYSKSEALATGTVNSTLECHNLCKSNTDCRGYDYCETHCSLHTGLGICGESKNNESCIQFSMIKCKESHVTEYEKRHKSVSVKANAVYSSPIEGKAWRFRHDRKYAHTGHQGSEVKHD